MVEAGEMAQLVRTLAALLEDSVMIPNNITLTKKKKKTCITLIRTVLYPVLCLGAPVLLVVHRHALRHKIHTHKNKIR